MNLNQVTVPCTDLDVSIAFYTQLGLRLIVHSPPDYARFECPRGNTTFSLLLQPEAPGARGVVVYFELEAWPDVPMALRALKDAGIRLAFLSNMTAELLEAGIRTSRLEGMFEHVLSTDAIKAYKPEPRAYQLAVDALELDRESILFAAFAGWDVAGARWFGYPTFWVNRLDAPVEELGVRADARGHGLVDLTSLLAS